MASAVDARTDKLREMVFALRDTLAQVADGRGVISLRLFRNAWLPPLADPSIEDGRQVGLARYDIAILIRLTGPDRIGEFLDEDAFRDVLDVLHAHGRDVVITPARNVRLTSSNRGGRLNLIHHLLASGRDTRETWSRGTGRYAADLQFRDREYLVPLHSESTPLRSIHRAEIEDVRARALVTALVRDAAHGDLATASAASGSTILPHLYWELSVGRRGRVRPPLRARGVGSAGRRADGFRPLPRLR